MITRINTATKADIEAALAVGGFVRFVWVDSEPILVRETGYQQRIDGRSYQGFLHTLALSLERTETGSTDTNDLVIEWRQKDKR